MSQHNEKNPHQHQSPLHDSSEAKPGMDSLAPEDGSHRPAAEPTPPGAQPTAPGSLKAPDTRNEKLNSLEDVRKGSENYALTTNQGVRIADDQNSLRAGSRGPTRWKILFCARKSLTLTMSASRNVLFMHADQQLTVISSHIKA